MNEMIERVARVLAINHGTNPDEEGPGLRHVVERDRVATILMDHTGPLWKMWIPDARTAIAAMREPTLRMLTAAEKVFSHHPSLKRKKVAAKEKHKLRYQAMIDEVLEK